MTQPLVIILKDKGAQNHHASHFVFLDNNGRFDPLAGVQNPTAVSDYSAFSNQVMSLAVQQLGEKAVSHLMIDNHGWYDDDTYFKDARSVVLIGPNTEDAIKALKENTGTVLLSREEAYKAVESAGSDRLKKAMIQFGPMTPISMETKNKNDVVELRVSEKPVIQFEPRTIQKPTIIAFGDFKGGTFNHQNVSHFVIPFLGDQPAAHVVRYVEQQNGNMRAFVNAVDEVIQRNFGGVSKHVKVDRLKILNEGFYDFISNFDQIEAQRKAYLIGKNDKAILDMVSKCIKEQNQILKGDGSNVQLRMVEKHLAPSFKNLIHLGRT